jgi:ribosomal-protein-alanine N-acetyltransferase
MPERPRSEGSPSFTMRRMGVQDLAGVLAIEVRSFSNPWHRSTFLGEIQNRSIAHPLVAETREDHHIIGYIMFWLIDGEAQINNIAVHPDFRRAGVGEKMLRFALDKIRTMGGIFVTLEVREPNAGARHLYEKLGFHVVGIRRGYYQNPPEDALLMSLVLKKG